MQSASFSSSPDESLSSVMARLASGLQKRPVRGLAVMCYYLAAQTWTHGSYCYESALPGVATADLLLHGTNSFAEVSSAGLVGASGAVVGKQRGQAIYDNRRVLA